MNDLNEKQKRFCDEYLIDLNGAQAAIRAGHSKKTARSIASENLTKPNIIEYLNKKREKLQEKVDLNHEWVLKNFKKIYEKCMEDIEVTNKDGDLLYTKFDSAGANKSNEMIGKHLGFFNEDESGDKTKPLVINIQTTKE